MLHHFATRLATEIDSALAILPRFEVWFSWQSPHDVPWQVMSQRQHLVSLGLHHMQVFTAAECHVRLRLYEPLASKSH